MQLAQVGMTHRGPLRQVKAVEAAKVYVPQAGKPTT